MGGERAIKEREGEGPKTEPIYIIIINAYHYRIN
jgi:hypothetical protein